MRAIRISYTNSSIHFMHQDKEIVMWDMDEWIEDPTLVYVLVFAAEFAMLRPREFIERIKGESKEGFCKEIVDYINASRDTDVSTWGKLVNFLRGRT